MTQELGQALHDLAAAVRRGPPHPLDAEVVVVARRVADLIDTGAVPEALPPWHVRDDTGRVWRLRARGAGIGGREYRLVAVDEQGGC